MTNDRLDFNEYVSFIIYKSLSLSGPTGTINPCCKVKQIVFLVFHSITAKLLIEMVQIF